MQISENIREIKPSATLAVTALAKELAAQGRDIIDLSPGEPDLPTPRFIAEAGVAAIQQGHTRYTAAAGMPALKKAIAATFARRYDTDVDPAGIVVSNGAKQAMFNVCFTLFGPGDRVMVPVPYWTSYPDIIRLARAEPVEVRTREERDFKVAVDDLDAAYDPSVRGLIINSPSNPSGAVHDRDEFERIVRWAVDRDVWLISDEIYEGLCYVADRAPGLLDLDPALRRKAVLVHGVSKSFAMTGWRIGFSYCDPELASAMGAVQSHITSNAATPSQYAALAAFSDPKAHDEALESLRSTFRRRRDLVVELLREHLPAMRYVRPDGAFYLFIRIDSWFGGEIRDSVALCRYLLEEAGVALVPGSAFGDDRFARLSFAASEEALTEGIRRIAGALAALPARP